MASQFLQGPAQADADCPGALAEHGGDLFMRHLFEEAEDQDRLIAQASGSTWPDTTRANPGSPRRVGATANRRWPTRRSARPIPIRSCAAWPGARRRLPRSWRCGIASGENLPRSHRRTGPSSTPRSGTRRPSRLRPPPGRTAAGSSSERLPDSRRRTVGRRPRDPFRRADQIITRGLRGWVLFERHLKKNNAQSVGTLRHVARKGDCPLRRWERSFDTKISTGPRKAIMGLECQQS